MKTIKISLISLLTVLTIIACKEDKKAQLAKLKKQQAELGQKISDLEKELNKSGEGEDEKLTRVSVKEIEPTVFKHYIEVQGRLDGDKNVDVQPEGLGGTVTEVLVEPGQAVKKGQGLATLNAATLRDQLKGLESSYKLAKDAFDRQQRLWDQKIGSEMQYLSAKANKEALEAQRSALQEQINMATIKSPVDGTVEEINVKVGQIASPASPIPAFRVVNLSSLNVKADVAEAYTDKVRVGDNVSVIFPDLNKEISAKITAVSRVINMNSRTFQVEAQINPEKDGFKANMIAVLKINDYKNDKALAISVNYIQSDMQGDFVYVAEKNNQKTIVKRSAVKQGQSYNGVVEITDGLKAGDMVITSGYLDLDEGEAIKY